MVNQKQLIAKTVLLLWFLKKMTNIRTIFKINGKMNDIKDKHIWVAKGSFGYSTRQYL